MVCGDHYPAWHTSAIAMSVWFYAQLNSLVANTIANMWKCEYGLGPFCGFKVWVFWVVDLCCRPPFAACNQNICLVCSSLLVRFVQLALVFNIVYVYMYYDLVHISLYRVCFSRCFILFILVCGCSGNVSCVFYFTYSYMLLMINMCYLTAALIKMCATSIV